MGRIRRLTIYTDKIKKSKKVLVYSDLHLFFKNNQQHRKLYSINELSPANFDFITIPGDFVQSTDIIDTSGNEILSILNTLTNQTKTYITIGNHDQYIRNGFEDFSSISEEKFVTFISQLPNFKYLKNGSTFLEEEIELQGINNSYHYYNEEKQSTESFLREYEAIQNNVPFAKDKFSILLTHDPKSIYCLSKKNGRCIKENTDLVITGHMHSGFVPNFMQGILNGRGFISPDYTLFPEYAYGTKTIGDTIFLINGAVSTYVENALINKLYGINCTIVELIPTEKQKRLTLTYK